MPNEKKAETEQPENGQPAGAATPANVDVSVLADNIDIPTPETRPLKCYAFDPSHGRFYGNEMTLEVKYEHLLPGPIGERVAVTVGEGACMTAMMVCHRCDRAHCCSVRPL